MTYRPIGALCGPRWEADSVLSSICAGNILFSRMVQRKGQSLHPHHLPLATQRHSPQFLTDTPIWAPKSVLIRETAEATLLGLSISIYPFCCNILGETMENDYNRLCFNMTTMSQIDEEDIDGCNSHPTLSPNLTEQNNSSAAFSSLQLSGSGKADVSGNLTPRSAACPPKKV